MRFQRGAFCHPLLHALSLSNDTNNKLKLSRAFKNCTPEKKKKAAAVDDYMLFATLVLRS